MRTIYHGSLVCIQCTHDIFIASSDQKETQRIKSELPKRLDIKEILDQRNWTSKLIKIKEHTLSQSSYIWNILQRHRKLLNSEHINYQGV